jgi:hypothetical protein
MEDVRERSIDVASQAQLPLCGFGELGTCCRIR